MGSWGSTVEQIISEATPRDRVRAFYVRGDLLRPGFGVWDSFDPVAHAILDVVEAQNDLADAFVDYAEGPGSQAASNAAIEAAEENRRTRADHLARLVNETNRATPE
jgi:hypothetical protein